MRTRWCALVLVGLLGCGEEEMMPPSNTGAPTAGPAGTAKPKATATATGTAAPDGAVCKVVERKVWAKGANPRTGLTPRDLGSSYGVGLAIGNRPHQLVFDEKGEGKLERLPLASAHGLGKGVPLGEGIRHLQRVTLTRGSRAFGDYRDKYEDGRRRIACGPLDRAKPYLEFEGKPLLGTDDSGKGRDKTPTTEVPSASPSASAAPSAAPSASASATASASAPAPSATAPPPAPPPTPTPAGVELRDCRTFSDAAGNDIFAVGSELYQEGGEWRMRFVLVPDEASGRRIVLDSFKLGADPKRLYTLEAPVAEHLADGSWVLAGRHRGQLLVWLLDKDKKPKGNRATFAGGYPSLPRYFNDGSGVHFMLTSQQVKPSIWKLRGLRFGNPAQLSTDLFDPKPPRMAVESAAEPTVTRVREQRWMTFHEGDRRRGVIKVVPVDAQIRSIGEDYQVTTPDIAAYESVSFGAGDELVVVYISRPNQGATELVSERLSCRVEETN